MMPVPPDDEDIARLLSDLKDKTPEYPVDLLAKRRAAYKEGMAGLGIGLVAGAAAGDAAAGGTAAGGTAAGGTAAGGAAAGGTAAGGTAAGGGLLAGAWSIDTILKALIITAMLVEGVGGAVMYRQHLLERNASSHTPTLTAPLPSPTPNPNSGLSVTTTATPTLAPRNAHNQLPDLVRSIIEALSRALERAGGP